MNNPLISSIYQREQPVYCYIYAALLSLTGMVLLIVMNADGAKVCSNDLDVSDCLEHQCLKSGKTYPCTCYGHVHKESYCSDKTVSNSFVISGAVLVGLGVIFGCACFIGVNCWRSRTVVIHRNEDR